MAVIDRQLAGIGYPTGPTTWFCRCSNTTSVRMPATSRRFVNESRTNSLSASLDSTAWGIPATGVLVETLLERGADDDVAEAEAAIDRLAVEPVDEGLVTREIWLLRLRALVAQALGDETAYRDYRDRHRDMARTLGFEGHIGWAEAMP
jgi:hypothetical protein